jgi:hypothetical protein
MRQAELQAARQRFTDEDLDTALKIAWDMLLAADHPAAAPERARHARRLIAEAIVGAAGDATNINGLWLAGVDPFRYEPFPQPRATSPSRRHQEGVAARMLTSISPSRIAASGMAFCSRALASHAP